MKNAKQTLLVLQDDEHGKAVIRRGTGDGSGYQLFMKDNASPISEACFPVDQDFVADEFKKQGKEWRREE